MIHARPLFFTREGLSCGDMNETKQPNGRSISMGTKKTKSKRVVIRFPPLVTCGLVLFLKSNFGGMTIGSWIWIRFIITFNNGLSIRTLIHSTFYHKRESNALKLFYQYDVLALWHRSLNYQEGLQLLGFARSAQRLILYVCTGGCYWMVRWTI